MPSDFDRVTPKHPCRICNKPDYCSISRNGRVSICMRVSAGAKGRARKKNGWIHINHDVPVTYHSPPRTPKYPTVKLAPLEVRDAIYRELIRLSPANRYRQLIDHPEVGLLSRGLLIKETLSYGALPPTQLERARLAQSLRSFAKARFPQYANLVGIPGFWQDEKGFSQIWARYNYRASMLLIPYKDHKRRIQACQLRLHPEDLTTEHPNKYLWLSSPNKLGGCSSGTPIHFTFEPKTISEGAEVVVIEGGLKADTLVSLRPEVFAIATSGVSCSHDDLINAARPSNLLIGFDADYKYNPAVCMQMASLIASRQLDLQQSRLSRTTKVLCWQGYKGIDEAALHDVPIKAVSIQQWFNGLSNDSRTQVQEIWREMKYTIDESSTGENDHEPQTDANHNHPRNVFDGYHSPSLPNTAVAGE